MLITSRDNHIIKDVQKLLKSGAYRKATGKYIIEGVRLSVDAAESGTVIDTLLLSQNATNKFPDACNQLQEVCESTFTISDKLFSQISDTKTPQGIMCICKKKTSQFSISQGCKYLALECLQDPSNMGTCLRTAEALGIRGVFLTEDCCDIYSPKVLRGSMGAVFRLPVQTMPDFSQLVTKLNSSGFTTLAAVPANSALPVTKLTPLQKQSCTVFIGNEGNGLLKTTIDNCTIQTTIPMQGRAESLNASVAAAIAMWEILREDA